MIKKINIYFLLATLWSIQLSAYDFDEGEWIIRPVLGARVNAVKTDAPDRSSPGAAMVLGAEADYFFDKNWSFGPYLKPMFSPNFITLGFGPQAKYHITQLDSPFVPYAALAVTLDLGIPVGPFPVHFNLGVRPALGLDYFVMRKLAIGLELAVTPSAMWVSGLKTRFELGVDALLAVSWRL